MIGGPAEGSSSFSDDVAAAARFINADAQRALADPVGLKPRPSTLRPLARSVRDQADQVRAEARELMRALSGTRGKKRKHYSKSKSRRGSLRGGFPFSEGSSENKTAAIAGGRFDRNHRDE